MRIKVKKALPFILIPLLVLALSGCGKGSGTSNAGSGSSASSSGKETASLSKTDSETSTTTVAEAKRTIAVESVTETVIASLDGEETTLVAGDHLHSGQEVATATKADISLLLDSDKHVYGGGDTFFYLKADGKPNSGKTRLELYKGTLTIAIDNKLNEEETFEVLTPNATMAVRGTKYTITLGENQDGFVTVLEVTEGKVAVKTIEDGEETEYDVNAGETTILLGSCPDTPDQPDRFLSKKKAYADSVLHWIETADISFTVGDLELGTSTIADAKHAYSGKGGYKSNLMNNDSEDTVYCCPYTENTIEGYTPDTFSYLFSAPVEGGPINHIFISDHTIDIIGGFHIGDTPDALWDYLGIRPDPELEWESINIKVDTDPVREIYISRSSFNFTEGNREVSFNIKPDINMVTGVWFNLK